jgi:hypothetical protein
MSSKVTASGGQAPRAAAAASRRATAADAACDGSGYDSSGGGSAHGSDGGAAAADDEAAAAKPFLKRRSRAVVGRKLDWSSVQSKTNSRLDDRYVGDSAVIVTVLALHDTDAGLREASKSNMLHQT